MQKQFITRQKHTWHKPQLLRMFFALIVISIVQRVVGRDICDGVVFLPSELVVTGAKDLSQQQFGGEDRELIDVHTYNHFYTFQVDRDIGKSNEGIEMRIPSEKFKTQSNEGFAFRLRAEFNSAEGSRTEMGFRVMVLQNKKSSDDDLDLGYSERITIADVSSLNKQNGEGAVIIDLPSLPSGEDYVLRYEFYMKEVIRRGSSLSMEEDVIASRDTRVQCNLPFFTQELSLIDRKVLKSRVRKYQAANQDEQKNISSLSCDFSQLQAKDSVEGGLDCRGLLFFYKLKEQSHPNGAVSLQKLAEFPIKVSGVDGRAVTQYFQLNIGTEFAFGAGLRAVIRRIKGTENNEEQIPFNCLLDQSCQISKRNEKNHVSLNVVLTSGDYLLQLYDQTQDTYSNWISKDLGLEDIPISVDIEAFPILQNEERTTCPYMYLTQDFIQLKFIEGQSGQRFFFNDKIVLDLVNLEQRITIFPEQDSYLKVFAREAFGVNLQMELCDILDNGDFQCMTSSQQVGTTELLVTEVKKKTKHFIRLNFTNSVFAFHSFKECPHIVFELSMISKYEAQLFDKNIEITAEGLQDSQQRLEKIFSQFTTNGQPFKQADPQTATFSMKAQTEQSFQVLTSHSFTNDVKFGVFIEIFNSPFQSDVLGLFLQSNSNNEDNQDLPQQEKVNMLNKYKNNKLIWVDLEPGTYTLQVICVRQTENSEGKKISGSRTQTNQVIFQLYMDFQFINVAREVFIPSSLNFLGLLGYKEESKDFGQVSLFYDDVTLFKDYRYVTFQVQSEMASLSIQLEQDGKPYFKINLQTKNQEDNKWKKVGDFFNELNYQQSIQTIEMDLLATNTTYRIVISKDKTQTESSIETAELGERYSHSFSLKIELSENDSEAISEQIRRTVTEQMPNNIQEISKVKFLNPGMKESAFKIGNRDIIELLETGNTVKKEKNGVKKNSFLDESPYQPKDTRIYSTADTDRKIITSIPFEVTTDSEMFFAGIYEYTEGANLLSLVIYEDKTHQEVAFSSQGKYYSRIDIAILPKGSYYLVVRNDKSEGENRLKKQAPIQFLIDVLIHKTSENDVREFLEALQLCPLPDSPGTGLNKIGYIHPLSGNNMQSNMLFKMIELDSGAMLPLKISDIALVTVYIEVSENIDVSLSIKETGGLRKTVAFASDQDSNVSNFLKQKGFIGRNVVSLRAVLSAGTYWIEAKANSFENVNSSFDQKQNFCETYSLSISVSSTKSATKPYFFNPDEEYCNSTVDMPNKLELNQVKSGNYVADLSQQSMALSYFDFQYEKTQGPYLFYFQMDYDMRQEGPVALVLSQYSNEDMLWKEVSLFVLSDSQSLVMRILENGTYGLSIQPIASTKLKFDVLGLRRQLLKHTNVFASTCFKARYTYFATTINSADSERLSNLSSLDDFFSFVSTGEIMRNILSLENQDDLRDLQEFSACSFDELPQSWPNEGNFEIQITPKIQSSKFEIVDLIVPQDSLLRVTVTVHNTKNKIQVDILNNSKSNPETIATSDFKNKQLSLVLKGRKKAYHMKFIYAFFDENDSCPLFNLHVSMKSLEQVVKEDLLCEQNPNPPILIEVKGKVFKQHKIYALSSDFLEQNKEALRFDIQIELEHSDYLLDLQIKSDFLTTNFDLVVYIQDPETEKYHSVAVSEDVLDMAQMGQQQNQVDNQNRVQRLKYLEDLDPSLDLNKASKLILRFFIEPETSNLLKELKSRGLYDPIKSPFCINFDFAFSAIEEYTKDLPLTDDQLEIGDTTSQLLRVNWEGNQMGVKKFLGEQRITLFLEFDKKIEHETLTKIKDQQIFFLVPFSLVDSKVVLDNDQNQRVLPQSKALAQNDNALLRIVFKPNSLKRGQCYQLQIGAISSISVSKEQLSSEEMNVCTTNCSCSMIGTSNCIENPDQEPVCVCRENYSGQQCDQCKAGFVKNEKGACIKGNFCLEDGGEEDCNGHGDCISNGGFAKCICHEGFANDGLDLCARCADPMFSYPHECQSMQRQYAILQENYECSKMPYQMPNILYDSPEKREAKLNQAKKDGAAPPEQSTIYEEQGMLDWSGRFSLISNTASHSSASRQGNNKSKGGQQLRKISEHEFLVPRTSVYRLFLNTLNSGAKVRYSILDPNAKLLFKNEDFTDQIVEFDQINPFSSEKELKPFKLIIEYEGDIEKDQCPLVEIHFVIAPYYFLAASLKCTAGQQNAANKFEWQMDFQSENKIRQEKVTLSSKQLGSKEGKFPWLSEDSEFLYMNIQMNVKESGHALSIMTAYKFADLHTILTLKDHDGKTLFVEKTSLLGQVPESFEVYKELPSTKDNKPVTFAPDLGSRDLVSFIEVNELAAGMYTLQIGVPKGYFFKLDKYHTCLDFDLVIEYIARNQLRESLSSDEDLPLQMVGISPLGMKDLNLNDKLSITIIFDQVVEPRSIAFSQSDLNKICKLQYPTENGQSTVIFAEQIFYHDNFAQVSFDFNQHSKVLNQLFQDTGRDNICFNLACQSERGKDLIEIVMMEGISNYQYCFKEQKKGVISISMCNGFAKPRFENGMCICTFPYTGETCDECEQDFEVQIIQIQKKELLEQSTICSPKPGSKYDNCNGFGEYMKSRRVCKCDQDHAGDFCEMCKDPNFQFPDCALESQQNLVDSDLIRKYEQRRRSQVYNSTQFQFEEKMSIFKQQCPLTNYPTFLNDIQNHKEFASGDFHIADSYITNHDADNIIQFTPRHQGLLKIFVKQPEAMQSVDVEEALDIEIAVAFQGEQFFLKTETNFNIDFKDKLKTQRTDFTVLYLDITEKLQDMPLLIFFRGMNFTHDDIKATQNQCQMLYIEIEFRSKDSAHKCSQDYPTPTKKQKAIVLQRTDSVGVESQGVVTFEDNGIEGFFFFQDYFIDQDNEAGYDLSVSLAQKFSDEVTIIPIIEIKGTELEDASSVQNDLTPQCFIFCEIAGHKSLNEMTLNTVVPYGTLFRVWLYKKASNKKICLNYELTIKHKSLSDSKDLISVSSLTCEHLLDLPQNFNTQRYLGVGDDQQDFEYVENFKIEHLSSNVNIKFKLSNDTLVRFQGLQHKQIKFNLSLMRNNQVLGISLNKQIPLDQGVHEPESSVFAALTPGDYKLKIQFINSQLNAISQPCQSIQLHIAMAKNQKIQIKSDAKVMPLSLQNLFANEKINHSFEYTTKIADSYDNAESSAFDILYEGVFKLEEKEGLNLLIKSTCDFLRLDISFILLNKDTNHIYSPQSHSEDKKKLLILDLPSGAYKLIVYARKCDVRTNDRSMQAMRFKMSMHLYSFDEKQKTYVTLLQDSKKTNGEEETQFKVNQNFISPDQLMCKEKFRHLPSNLIEDNLSLSLDFEMHFSISGEDLVFSKKKIMSYKPPTGKDALRIQVSDGIYLKIFLKKDYKNNINPINQSSQMLGNQYEELVVKDLDSSKDYVIELNFAGEHYSSCLHGNMQILITSSDYSKCLGKDQLNFNNSQLSLSHADDAVVMEIASCNPKELDSTPLYQLTLKDDKTDLEVSLDYSNTLYGPRLLIYRQSNASVAKVNYDNGNQNLLNQVADSENLKLKPSSIFNIKHQTRYLFNNLQQGVYSIRIFQPSKQNFSDNCHDMVTTTFKASPSIDSMLEGASSQYHQQIKFMSKMPDSDSIRRMPVSLPINLNQFKYLGGGQNEKKYLLFSDIIELQNDDKENKISLDITEENTKVRIYFEDSTLSIKIQLNGVQQNISVYPYLVQFNAKIGKYDLFFYHYTEQAKSRRLYFKDLVQMTILVAEPAFVASQYEENMKDGLSGCKDSQFPLALAKNTQYNVAEEQSYYNYPLLRAKNDYDQELATYSFRFNETQRIYFEIGSNFIQSHAILKLTPKSSKGKSFIVGRQSGNVNVLDMIVPPGDYQLIVKIFVFSFECGIYSLRGLLNQKSAMIDGLADDADGFMQGTSQCLVKGDPAPSIIYQSKSLTSLGNEEFISDDGVYFKAFNDVLIVKSRREVLQPWVHEIELSSSEESIFKVVIQSDVAEKMSVRLTQLYGNPVEPTFQSLRQVQTGFEVLQIKELSYIFDLQPNWQYYVEIEFYGDMFDQNQEENDCAYFNLVLSITQLKKLYNQLLCSEKTSLSKIGNLAEKLPYVIQEGKDFNEKLSFEEKGIYTLKYPDDFIKLKYGQEAIMISQKIQAQNPFTIGGQIFFELPFSDWQFTLYNIPNSSKKTSDQTTQEMMLQIEQLADAGLLQQTYTDQIEENGKKISIFQSQQQSNMRRVLDTLIVTPEAHENNQMNLLIVFQESQASKVLKSITVYAERNNLPFDLCLPVGVQLSIQSQKSQQKIIDDPKEAKVIAFKLMHGGSSSTMQIFDMANGQESLPYGTKYVNLVVQLSREPLDDPELKKAFVLNVISENMTELKMNPINIQISNEGVDSGFGYIIGAQFDLNLKQLSGMKTMQTTSQQILTVGIDAEKIFDKENNPKTFVLSDEIKEQISSWSIPIQPSEEQKMKAQVEGKEKGTKVKDKLQDEIKKSGKEVETEAVKTEKKVKCKCVHGKCKKGESTCSECDQGYQGVLCDLPTENKKRTGIKIEDQDEIEDVVFKKEKPKQKQDQETQIERDQTNGTKFTEIKKQTYQPEQQEDVIQLQALDQKQGWIEWLFFAFVELVKKGLYLVILIISLFLIKFVCEKISERVSRDKIAKDRKQGAKGKKQESDYEGVRFSDGDDSGDDESGLVSQPIELTTIKPKKKKEKIKQIRKSLGSFNSAADSDSDEEQRKLKLFAQDIQQDQPMSDITLKQPQDSSTISANQFNPFDQEVTQIYQESYQESYHPAESDKQGDAILNEIDDALNDLSGSDDDGEYQSFV